MKERRCPANVNDHRVPSAPITVTFPLHPAFFAAVDEERHLHPVQIGSVISKSYTEFHDYFNHPNDQITGAIVSVFAGGAFFGAILAGYTADAIGRKRTIQLGSLIAVLGCTLQTAAVTVPMLIVGRFVAGWSIGVLSMIVPMYQAEISPPHARGLLSGWTQLMIGWGFFVANW